jgi:hypothetical protein
MPTSGAAADQTGPLARALTEPAHQACVRLLRADYCGDGEAATRDSTPVNVFDRLGVQAPDPGAAAAMAFEAAWGPDGAVCVARTRVPEVLTLDALAARCPRLRGRLGPRDCPEPAGDAPPPGGALLLNRS